MNLQWELQVTAVAVLCREPSVVSPTKWASAYPIRDSTFTHASSPGTVPSYSRISLLVPKTRHKMHSKIIGAANHFSEKQVRLPAFALQQSTVVWTRRRHCGKYSTDAAAMLAPPCQLPAGLSFTFASKRLPAPASPLHAEKSAANASCRRRPAPILSSRPAPAPNLFQDTPSNPLRKHSSTLQQYPTYFQLYRIASPSTTITMVAFKVLVAAALACVVVAHNHPADSECTILL